MPHYSLLSKALVALSFTARLAAGNQVPVTDDAPFLCGNPPPTEAQLKSAEGFLEHERILRASALHTKRADIVVNTYFHVLANAETEAGGYLTTEALDGQLVKMNEEYGKHGFTFNLVDTDWTINAGWAAGSNESAMKTELRKGSYSDLNVYFHNTLPGGLGGRCPFPGDYAEGTASFLMDGCIVLSGSVPGGSMGANYDQGGILVHEIGHWMDLYHTFSGGCAGGDQVDDTPAQAQLTRGCPPIDIGNYTDTCPDLPGFDPVHNFMDYSGDICWSEFTAGQADRMHSAWIAFRQG